MPLHPRILAQLNEELAQHYRDDFNEIISVDASDTSTNTAASGVNFGIAYAARELKAIHEATGWREEDLTPGPKLDADDLQALADFIATVAEQAKADEAKATEFALDNVNIDELLERIVG